MRTLTRLHPFVPLMAVGLVLAHVARAAAAPGGVDMLPVLEALVVILVAAKLGGSLFERFGQSAVLEGTARWHRAYMVHDSSQKYHQSRNTVQRLDSHLRL